MRCNSITAESSFQKDEILALTETAKRLSLSSGEFENDSVDNRKSAREINGARMQTLLTRQASGVGKKSRRSLPTRRRRWSDLISRRFFPFRTTRRYRTSMSWCLSNDHRRHLLNERHGVDGWFDPIRIKSTMVETAKVWNSFAETEIPVFRYNAMQCDPSVISFWKKEIILCFLLRSGPKRQMDWPIPRKDGTILTRR